MMTCKVFSKDLDLQNPNPPTIEKTIEFFGPWEKLSKKTIEFFGGETIETIEKTIEKKRSGCALQPLSVNSQVPLERNETQHLREHLCCGSCVSSPGLFFGGRIKTETHAF